MKRKEIDRRLTQLLDRIDGELAEVRDGLIQVDDRSARHQARITDLEDRMQLHIDVSLPHLRNADHSRKV